MKAGPKLTYFLCGTFRSGSWLLAEALEGTGIAGRPREYLEPPQIESWQEAWKLSCDAYEPDYLNRMVQEATTENGVCAIKVHRPAFRLFIKGLRVRYQMECSTEVEVLDKFFPNLKFVWLSRSDKVRQAVSWYRASQDGRWWQLDSEPHPSGKVEPVYRFTKIRELVEELTRQEEEWHETLRLATDRTIRVCYEEWVQDRESSIRSILQRLGIPEWQRATVPPARLQKQSDQVSDWWVGLYSKHSSNSGRG